jgi:hypothetical protein
LIVIQELHQIPLEITDESPSSPRYTFKSRLGHLRIEDAADLDSSTPCCTRNYGITYTTNRGLGVTIRKMSYLPAWQNVTYRQIDAKMIQMMKLGCAF